MITIEITNLDELVKEHRGPVTALLGKIVADVEGEVEKIIIEEIRNEFERHGLLSRQRALARRRAGRWRGPGAEPAGLARRTFSQQLLAFCTDEAKLRPLTKRFQRTTTPLDSRDS